MILKPDLGATYIDPFSATPMLILCCNVVEPATGELTLATPFDRDPRRGLPQGDQPRGHRLCRALKPNSSCSTTSVSATIITAATIHLDDIELPTNTGRSYEGGNMAHRPRAKGGYFPGRSRSTARSTSAARWSRPCSRWACPATSTITRSLPPSMSSA
jgi:glutamine synthetase